MKFSVIVPVYNVEPFLRKCLDSILAQTFNDYEIITVNDGSTDNSLLILQEYLSRSDKVRVISQENKGLGGARNTGINNAKGEYIVLVDSDDYIENNMLYTLYNYLTNYDLDILAFDCNYVNTNYEFIQYSTNKDYPDDFSLISLSQFLLFQPTAWCKVYKRELFIKNNVFYPEKLWYEDLATTYRLAANALQFGYLKRPLYNYVQQANSITHSTDTQRMLEIIKAFDITLNYFKEQNYLDRYYAELEWLCVLHVVYYSAHRLFSCGFNIRQMKFLLRYVKRNFPDYLNNKYVNIKSSSVYQMDLILKKRYFSFFYHNYILVRIYNIYKIITKS